MPENEQPAPGEKYRHLIRTPQGHTVDDRCGTFCFTDNIVEWTNAARELSARVNRAWKRLIYVETGPGEIKGCGPGGEPEVCPSAGIRERVNQYFGTADDLPGWWDLFVEQYFYTPDSARNLVDQAVANMEEGVLLLEQINDGITAVGGEPLSVPPAPTKEPESGFWSNVATAAIATTVILGMGAGIYYIAKRRGAKSAATQIGDSQ